MKRLLIFALAIGLAGCAARVQHVTNLPAGVTEKQAQDWDTAVANLHKVAIGTSTLRQAVIELNTSNLIAQDKYVAALRSIGNIDEAQLAASNVLKAQPQNFGIPVKIQVNNYMKTISAEVGFLNTSGLIGIKNPNSQNLVNKYINDVMQAALLVLSLTT